MDFSSVLNLLLLIFGFGLVIFWHELGHFLAAKWAGVKVEQFAVGFGQALLCWRKGIGLRVGTTKPEYERRANELLKQKQETGNSFPFAEARNEEHRLDLAAAELGLSETEYRLNWLPLGGYVKMLGQDDMNPNAASPDPRAYNNKSIGKRMVIVSAGVIMNIILAAILFVVLFLWGFTTPAPVVGYAQAGSPAQRAGLEPGDRILRFNGDVMHDFGKIRLATALAHPTEPSDVVVRKPDGREVNLKIVPIAEATEGGFLQIGVGPSALLQAPDELDKLPAAELTPELSLLKGGERITAVNGIALQTGATDSDLNRAWYQFDQAVQNSGGKSLEMTVQAKDGSTRQVSFKPTLDRVFGSAPPNIAGLQPRTVIEYLQEASAARGKLQPGDVVTRLSADTETGDAIDHPTLQQFLKTVEAASNANTTITIDVLRNGEKLSFPKIPLAVKIQSLIGIDRRGLGVGMDAENDIALIAGVLPESSAAKAGVKPGAKVVAVNDTPVQSWIDVFNALRAADKSKPINLTTTGANGNEIIALTLSQSEADTLSRMRFTHGLPLKERTEERKTNNPFTALAWGAGETRDLIVQFYVTLKRMLVQRSVSPSQMSGPLGILHSGTLIASRGPDWLVWYLAVISANLAVVNFLPIPIVDGGLFLFLIIEKLRGKPVPPSIMTATQLAGLALILSLFLFVTYNDILRLF